MRLTNVALLLIAARLVPAETLFEVGLGHRSFVPANPFSWRGAKTHALLTMVWYPAQPASVEQPQWLGPPDSPLFAVGSAAPDARPASGKFPLIVLSHGTGGSALMLGAPRTRQRLHPFA